MFKRPLFAAPFAVTLSTIALVGMSSAAQAGVTYIDSNTTINTSQTGTDFYVGLHANGVVLTVATGAVLNGDRFTGGIRLFNDSRVEMTGGTVAGIDSLTNSVVHVTGGTVSSVSDYTNALIGGGTITDLSLLSISNSSYNSVGRATISGGTLTHVTNGNTGTGTMNGGTLTGYIAQSSISTFNLSGGTITGTLYSLDQYNTYNIYGSGLTLTNPVAGPSVDFNGAYTGTYYNLTGTLADGTPINTRYFSTGSNGVSRVNLINGAAAPEPSAWALLATGLLAAGCVVTRRQKRLA